MAPFRRLSRRAGPVGIVLTAIDLWGRLTPAQRRRVLRATRKHGPKVAKAAVKQARSRRGPKV
jgi:hypothetical protein